jgi:DDE family transposase
MGDATGEADGTGLRVAFDRRLKLEFHGATVTSDAGLLAFRELDDGLGLTAMAAQVLADPRTGRNGRHSLIAQLRQSVFGRLAGYEDVNDADRLGRDPAMRWIVGGRAVTEQAASTSQMGRFETSAMTEERNLTALADLSGHWIDRVQPRRARTALVLDIDSSVSPTYGAQEGTAYNGHFACTCYHPLFVFNQDGDLERCALRPGNVHSAHGWRDVLDPVVARYRGQALRRLLRGDAAFALPDVYEYLEAEGFQYAIRLPANQVLQAQIAHLLTRPVGRPPHYVRRFYASFRYQAQSWSRARRVVAKVEWHPGELYPPRRLHRDEPPPTGQEGRRLLQRARHGRAVHQGGQARGQVDAAVVHDLPGQRGAPPTPRAGLQPGQLPPHARTAGRGRAVVADEPAGKGGEDRREGDRPRPLRDLPDGGGGGAARAVRPHLGADRKATSARPSPMLTLEGCNARQPGVELRPECVLGCRSQAERRSEVSRTPVAAVTTPEHPCLRGRKGTMQAQARGWTLSIWEMSG